MNRWLLCLPLLLLLGGCGKTFLKRTKIMLVANPDSVQVNIITSDYIKYLDGVDATQVTEEYLSDFKNYFFDKKLTLVDDNPDYVLQIHSINVRESVWQEYVGAEDYYLSRMTAEVEYSISPLNSGSAEYHRVTKTMWERIEEGYSPGDGTHHSGLADSGQGDGPDNIIETSKAHYAAVRSYGGLSSMLYHHTLDAHNYFKEVFKLKQ